MSDRDRISLRNASHIFLKDEVFEGDFAIPMFTEDFEFDCHELKPLLIALLNGTLRAQGYLAKVRIDYPEFDQDTEEHQLAEVSRRLRQNSAFMLGLDQEAEETDVPPEIWWSTGAIWEQSSLWLSNPMSQNESSGRGLRPFPPSSDDPAQPYEREELIFFRDISLSVAELNNWVGRNMALRKDISGKNPRNAGRKAKEDWGRVRDFLLSQIDELKEWEGWDDVWADIQHLLEDKTRFDGNNHPHKSFQEWLRRNDTGAYKRLQNSIKNSPQYRSLPQ
jgi:hypothetical protein